MTKQTPYFVLSNSSGRFFRRGHISELPTNIVELLKEGYMCSVWDIGLSDPDELVNNLAYGTHPSFAFNEDFDELCLGDYV